MTERGAPLSFVGFWRPPMTPPQTPQYLTILQTERGRALPLLGFWRPPPSPDATILNYLNDREGGRHYLMQDFAPPPFPRRHNT